MTDEIGLDVDSLGEAGDARGVVVPRRLLNAAVEDVDYKRIYPPCLIQFGKLILVPDRQVSV